MSLITKAEIHHEFKKVSIAFIDKTNFLANWEFSFKAKQCWICKRRFALIPDVTLSVALTSAGNKYICNSCALALEKAGVQVDKNALINKDQQFVIQYNQN